MLATDTTDFFSIEILFIITQCTVILFAAVTTWLIVGQRRMQAQALAFKRSLKNEKKFSCTMPQ